MQAEHQILTKDQNLMINQIDPIKLIHEAHSNSIEALAVHPNQTNFATGSHDRTIKIWDVEKFKETVTLADHKQGVWTLDYSKDGSLLASGGPDKSVLIWDSKKNSPGTRISAHKDKVYCAKFNETSKLLGTCGEQGQIFVWDIAKPNQPLAKIQKQPLVLYDLKWSGNEEYFFVSSLGSELYAFSSKNFAQISSDVVTPNVHDSKCETVAANFKLINNRVFCGTSRGVIAWYQMSNNSLVKRVEFDSHLDSVRTINLHSQRKIMLSTGRDGSARLWDASANDLQPTLLGNLVLHNENIPGAGFIGNDMALTGSWDQKLALWSLKSLIK